MQRLDCDRMFIAVMESGSFTAAAQRLGTSHGQASKLISRLEQALGVQLFRRSTRSLTPTDVGNAYYQRVRPLIADYDALNDSVRNIAGSPAGVLRISAPVTFGTRQLTGHLVEFARRYADIELDVSFNDRLVSVVDEGFDLALRIGHLEDSNLIARKLCDIRVITLASEGYLAARGVPEHWSQLAQHDCIIDTNFREPGQWRYRDAHGHTHTQTVRAKMRFSNAEVCLQAACADLGITRLPTFVASRAVQEGLVRPLLQTCEAAPLGLFAVYSPAKYLAARSRLLIDFLIAAFAGQPDWDSGL
ncbi:DNA-binding transcriptional LysR family regulator [Enterobacter sp. BIGb0383]|uniref:LysR family transcriptional regulator n=1 Tax=unclassified Enterobacter TaxID=2608935 RepID=UPI000F495DF0|nr:MULTISPECIES: LysR family transcriptional regulator [unclassified Enterobacter]ROP59463.1 DNA-binding transcriptional LysR family regulator [Enterobacter sp. BIGb0383]ROS09070.1 DNA-binding transcriptional LysR family regulator [Enterobacter sp. BIGb0359]